MNAGFVEPSFETGVANEDFIQNLHLKKQIGIIRKNDY